MFAESSEFERERWVQSVERQGFHCEQGMKIETFLFTHPIRAVIEDQNLQFFGEEVKGYLLSIVREFYSNLRMNFNVDSLLETTISGKQLMVGPNSITRSLHYDRPITHNRPYPLRAIIEFDANLFATTMCTNPVPMGGLVRKEFILGKLKPEYALMNKVIHNMIGPKGKEKLPSKEEIQFLYEVMNGKIIDYALVIWCIMRDFLRSLTENRHIPFPTLAIFGASSSSALGSMSTSPLKRMECRIKGWFKCILGKKKQLDHRLSRLESHILRGEPVVVDDPNLDLERDYDELDDYVDEYAFSLVRKEEYKE